MISKEEFLEAYMNHKPNKYTKWVYKQWGNLIVQKVLTAALLILFTWGFFATVIFGSKSIMHLYTTIPYASILVAILLLSFPAAIMNRIRQGKIMKMLGINTREYNALVNKYIKR